MRLFAALKWPLIVLALQLLAPVYFGYFGPHGGHPDGGMVGWIVYGFVVFPALSLIGWLAALVTCQRVQAYRTPALLLLIGNSIALAISLLIWMSVLLFPAKPS